MKNITVILYWEEKQDRNYHLVLSSRMEVFCEAVDEQHMLCNSIENCIRNYHNDYYNSKKYYNTEHYWKIYPDEIHVLIDGNHYNHFDYFDNQDYQILGEKLIQYCHDAIDNFVNMKNIEIDEKIHKETINAAAIKAESEIAELKRLQKMYPNIQ